MLRMRAGHCVALVAALTTCCGAAFAQQSSGPDVIVGDLPDITNNGLIAAPNGITYDGLAVGTTSCNKGNATLNWHTGGSDNRHPAISQNLYRLSNGRFEQIGQGWLKHGFTALQGTICQSAFGFPCTTNPDGTALGTGCSDPYSSGLNNGTGSGMGPRWQVNAATGLFPYPYAVGAGAAIRVRPVDLTTGAGERYFVEGQYICGDDAGSNNKNNNASWREVTAAVAADTTFTLAGSTTRELPAIYAWRTIDPTVTINTFDVASDGRFILACKVTGPAAGLYTYEYALHNLNSHRCAGSFIVPLPGTQTALTGVGFHDSEAVGEPNALVNPGAPASDDWAVTGTGAGSTSVSWAGPAYSGSAPVYTVSGTTPYLVTGYAAGTGNDHTANVIRWGTLFNFRFTCNIAPATGSIAVGLFRPGTGTSFVITIPTPGGASSGALTASCCTGTVCSVATQAVCGAGAWGLPGSSCSPDPCASGACCLNGVCSSTNLAGCTGTFTSGGACSPNPCPVPTGACCAGGSCTVSTQPTCSGTYQGNSTTCASVICPSGNDACAGALPLCAGSGLAGTTVGATFTAADYNLAATVCGSSGSTPDVWYAYTPATTGSISIDTCTAGYDTVISANTGTCGNLAEVACNDDAGTAAPPSGCGAGNNLHSRITFNATAGIRYLIRVSGFNTSTGTFTVLVTGGGGTGCNSTGRCCTGTTCNVTTSAACTGTWTASGTCASNPCNPSGACCNGTSCTSTLQSACAGIFTSAGVCSPNPCNPSGRCCSSGSCAVTVALSCTGNFTIAGTCTPNPCPPLSDDCANRSGIPVGSTPFDTTNATTDGTPNALCNGSNDSQIGKDVWFNFPCTFDGTIDIDTCGSTFDTKLAVYDGYGCANLDTRILACNDDSTCAGTAGLQSTISAIAVLCGHHYTIRVGGYTNGAGVTAAGPGTLTITAHPNALGICCAADGSCAQSQQSCCVGTWAATGACSPNTCPQPTGACCNPGTGACTTATHTACAGGNNLYQGDNSLCNPNPCPQANGACCVGTSCSITAVGGCTGTFQGSGSVCGTPANPTTCCKANFNQVNGVNVQDIFDFLAGFFAGDPRCDFDANGVINVQDIFGFLAAFFAGC